MNVLTLLLLIAVAQPVNPQPDAGSRVARRERPGLWIAGIAFSPADIASATQSWDNYIAVPTILITFTETGRAKWQRLQQGQVGQQLEISVDGEVVTSPVLREIITGAEVTISGGGFTPEGAAALARRIAPPQRR